MTGNAVSLDADEPADRLVSPWVFARGAFRLRSAPRDKYRLRGLLKVLHMCFYPEWTYAQVTAMHRTRQKTLRERGMDSRGPAEQALTDGQSLASMATKIARQTACSQSQNKLMAQGLMVDRQCNEVIMHEEMKAGKWTIPMTTQENDSNLALLRKWAIPTENIPTTYIHPLVWRFFHYMDARGLVPRSAQVAVGHAGLGIATAIDQLWIESATGRTVLVELKKWESGTYYLHTGRMRPPLHRLKNSACNQHQLQLVMSLYLLQHTFDISVDMAWVVRLHTTGLRVYPLRAWARDPEVMDSMLHVVRSFTAPLRRVRDLPDTLGDGPVDGHEPPTMSALDADPPLGERRRRPRLHPGGTGGRPAKRRVSRASTGGGGGGGGGGGQSRRRTAPRVRGANSGFENLC
jgi:hypothetical protein